MSFSYKFLCEEYDLLSFRSRVSAIILNEDGKLIVGLFKKGQDGKEYIGLAGGGIDTEDQNEEEAVIRETKEEFGIKVDVIKKLDTKLADYAEYYGGKENIPSTLDKTYGQDGFKTIFFLCKFKNHDKSLYGSEPDMARVKLINIKDYYDYTYKRMLKYKQEKDNWLYFLLKQEIDIIKEYLL